jgi:predicted Fe-Mo cluster-binding NifX family protein
MMKIAVPVTKENQIEDHFGHCDSYSVFTISDNKEISGLRSVDSSEGCGCKSDIGSLLASDGVTVMLAAGIGGGATDVLKSNGIEVIRGCSGDATEVVKLYLSGKVEDQGSSCRNHEGHHHGHEGHHHDHIGHHHHHEGHIHGDEMHYHGHMGEHHHGTEGHVCNHEDGHVCNHN